MLLAGVKPEAVAVISPLRAQLKLLRREMGHLKRIEVNTVDKYQVGGVGYYKVDDATPPQTVASLVTPAEA